MGCGHPFSPDTEPPTIPLCICHQALSPVEDFVFRGRVVASVTEQTSRAKASVL